MDPRNKVKKTLKKEEDPWKDENYEDEEDDWEEDEEYIDDID